MLIINIIYFLLSGFLGYLIGRWGDCYLNFWIKDPPWVPHHWIYGAILAIISFFIFKNYWFLIFPFGVGLFISDLKDFFAWKFIGSDGKTKEDRRFWHID